MSMSSVVFTRVRLVLVLAACLAAGATAVAQGASVAVAAEAAIRAAVIERLGDVEVAIVALDLPAGAADAFRTARPDPAARLGKPMRFTLVPVSGRPVFATATLRVVGEHVVARRDLRRGHTVASDDVSVVRGELTDAPLRRLPTGDQVLGSRVLRPVPADSIVLPGAVVVRRAVEPGDKVTAVAASGAIRVTATLTATDGGEAGDVIRLLNRDTRRSLRGRIVRTGVVEVGYARTR